ncbi:MAG: PocR ligand-binding domain-containing protein [Syntrophobacteraceae bacterium]|nr:PocR ligand-binding domain-containing protein [Syntrophobacteraceae bacterium]
MNVRLSDLLDIEKTRETLNNFSRAVGIPAAIIDLEGNVLVASPWQRICTDFHRQNETSRRKCIESSTILANILPEGENISSFTCLNGLTVAASPIAVDGTHLANAFVTQFFTENPDLDFFRRRAAELGFDQAAYMGALEKVPIVGKENLPAILSFLSSFAELIGSLGLKQKRQLEVERQLRTTQIQLEKQNRELWSIQDELQLKNEELSSAGEELRAQNEELQNHTEELRAIEEELRDQHEELQCRNEELAAIEEELRAQNEELAQANERVEFLAKLPAENPNPVLRIGADGAILHSNKAASALLAVWESQSHAPEFLRMLLQDAFKKGLPQTHDVEVLDRVFSLSIVPLPDAGYVNVYGTDITERKQAEARQGLLTGILQVFNGAGGLRSQLADALALIRKVTGFDAVGLRLRLAGDYPFYQQAGFSDEFLDKENFLCSRRDDGEIIRDAEGRAQLECTCGLVLSGRCDPAMPFFTEGGSFWTNLSNELLTLKPEADPRINPRNRCIQVGYMSVGLFPVRAGQEILGLLQLTDRKEGRFTPESIRFYEGLAQNIGLAVQRSMAEEALRGSEAQFKLLSNTAGNLLASDNPRAIVDQLCRDVMLHLDCHACLNFIVDDSLGRLHLNAYAGITAEDAAKIEWLDFGGELCGCEARDGVRVVAEDILRSPGIGTDLLSSYGIRAFASHPLTIGGRVIGTLCFGTKTRPRFSPRELAVMETFANQVAIALERIRLIGGLRRSRDQLELRVQERTAALHSATEALREQSRQVDAFFSHSMGPLVFLDRGFNFIRVNEAFAKACGLSPQQFTGRNYFQMYPSEELENEFQKVVDTKEPYLISGRPFTSPDHPEWGLSYWDLKLEPILDSSGNVDFLVFSLDDVTEQKKAEMAIQEREKELRAYAERLELVNQELQEFAFIASHDLQEPLRKIQTFGNMLRTRCATALDERGMDYLARMENAATRMRGLIHDLLEFSRVTTRPEAYTPVDLRETLNDIIELFEHRLPKEGANIEISDLPVIDADESQMKQLFQNLIGNALKYRSEKEPPHVKIYGKRPGNEFCQIFVEDNGIGFEQEFAEKIFAPFQRLHAKGKYEGTGMGLAICRKIVERHGGTITARSRPGKGATFIITLPFRSAKKALPNG